MSVLRNTDLHSVATLGRSTLRPQDAQAIWNFVAQISGAPLAEIEKQMTIIWTVANCIQTKAMLEGQAWKRYPPEPPSTADLDPDEHRRADEREEWSKFLKKWKQLKKRGGTAESIAEAFEKWSQNN